MNTFSRGAISHHSSLLQRDRALLVVVDMQEPFLRNIWQKERLVERVSILIQAVTVLGVPILATTQYQDRMGGIVSEIQSVLATDTGIVDKMTFSCFGSSEFAERVRQTSRKQIILCGVETHICVHQTSCDAMIQGYDTQVVADAVSSRSELNWQLGIDRLRQEGVIVTNVESAVYELLGQAGTSEFKEILRLIR